MKQNAHLHTTRITQHAPRLGLQEPDAPLWTLWPAWGALAGRVVRERPFWIALGAGLLALVLAYQSPRSLFLDLGSGYDNGEVAGFYAPEQNGAANYRWSAAQSSLVLPGLGAPLSAPVIQLQLSSGRAAGSAPIPVNVSVNGHASPPLQLAAQTQAYPVRIDPDWLDSSGDVRLDFSAPTFVAGSDKRVLGFNADFARIQFAGGPVIPALPQLALLLLAAALIYLLLRATWLAARWAGWLAFGFLLAATAIVAVDRLLLTVFTGPLVIALILALLTALLTELGAWLVVRWAGWRGAHAVPEWAWAGLRGLVAVSALVKAGGLLYPDAAIVDAYFHLKYITYMSEVLAGQRSWNQFFGQSLAFAVMPKEEWGAARAFIPYSPFFYVLGAPLVWLPVPLSMSVAVVSGLADAVKVAFVFLLGLAWGRGRDTAQPDQAARLGLGAAAVYAVIPATFLLLQWGNWPTQLSLWIVTLWAAVTCLFWARLARPLVWAVSTALLTLAFLSYTVNVVYTGMIIVIMVVVGWLLAPAERRQWAALTLSLVVAGLLSLVLYYGQYLGLILASTLPTFGTAIEQQGSLTTLRPTPGVFLGDLAGAMRSYNLILIYGLGLAGTLGLLLGRAGGIRPAQPWARVWIGAWLAAFPIFALADYWVDQAFKEFWYALPALAVVVAAWLLTLSRVSVRAALGRAFVGLASAALVWQSLSLWVFRLLFHNR